MVVLWFLAWLGLYVGSLYVAALLHSWWLLAILAVLTYLVSRTKHLRLMWLLATLTSAMISVMTMPLLSNGSVIGSWGIWTVLDMHGFGLVAGMVQFTLMSIICVICSMAWIGTMAFAAIFLSGQFD